MKKKIILIFLISLLFISGCNLNIVGKKNFQPAPEPTCTDSDDGLNYYIQGTVTDKNGYVVTDLCINETLLHEYECIENGDYNAVDYVCECNDGVCNPCKMLVEATNSIRPMNLIFVPVNYQQNQIFYNNPYNLLDYSVNFENDIYRFLYSNNETDGYGLLNVEPFVSNLNRMNIYMYSIANQFEEQNYVGYYTNVLNENCGFNMTNSFVYGIIGEHQSVHSNWGGGSFWFSSSHRIQFFNGYMGIVTTFRHELGHEIGFHDIYGPAYYSYQDIFDMWEESQNNYEDFWDFYEDFIIGFFERPNCDFTSGCPKWCIGGPLTNNIEGVNPCQNYTIELECDDHGPGIIGGSDCIWFPSEHPYFETRCISIGGNTENIGTNCLEGAGCYFGCQGHGWRSYPYGDLAAQWIDTNNLMHGYDVPSENFIKNLFNCCHPENCVNYDREECNEFFDKWEDKNLNYMDRYSCRDVCPLVCPLNCGWVDWSDWSCHTNDDTYNRKAICSGSTGCSYSGENTIKTECEWAGSSMGYCKNNPNGDWKCRSRGCVVL